MSLLECQKAQVSEDPLWINVFAAPKHWRTLHGGCFILILRKSETKSSSKTSIPVRSEILGLSGNMFTANNMNTPQNKK